MEASSIAIAQRRLVGTEFAAVGFTNLSQDHLDFHGDLETLLRGQGVALRRALPARRQRRRRLRRAARRRAALRGRERGRRRALRGASSCGPTAPSCSCARRKARSRSSRGCAGASTSTTCSCAVALALLLGVPARRDRAGRRRSTGAPPGRFEPVEAGQGFGVIVDYAHTPGGIAAVLASARPLARGRLLCVFGAGGDRDQAKRPLMGAAAEAGRRSPLRHERQPALGARRA